MRIILTAIAGLVLTGCATSTARLANEAGISISVQNTALQDRSSEAYAKADAHCAQYDRKAKLDDIVGMYGYSSGTYNFSCVNTAA
jgi:outer membrane biogenesis lipoprotein LolB